MPKVTIYITQTVDIIYDVPELPKAWSEWTETEKKLWLRASRSAGVATVKSDSFETLVEEEESVSQ